MKRSVIIIGIILLFVGTLQASAQTQPIYLVDLSHATTNEKLITLSLQGIANRSPESPPVYALFNSQDEGWFSWAQSLRNRPVERVTAEQLLERLRPLLKGQILCEPSDSTSLNIAASLAGLHDSLLTDHDLGLPTLFDLRTRFKSPAEGIRWAEKEILPKASRQGLALLGLSLPFRDYLIKERLAALPIPPLSDKEAWSLLARIASSLPEGSPIFSPSPAGLPSSIGSWAARLGHPLLGADEAANLSYHSQLQTADFRQWRSFLQLEGKIYLCFILSGGDDLSYLTGRMADLWLQPERGSLPLGWAIPARMAQIAPDILQAYFASAYRSGNDEFLLLADKAAGTNQELLRPLAEARGKSDIRALALLDDSPEEALSPALEKLAADFRPSGIFLPDHKSLPSKMLGESVLATKGFFASDPQEILQRLSALPAGKGGLVFVLADARAISTADIASIAALLPSYFELVGPEEFLFLARQILTGEKEEIPSQTKVTLTVPQSANPEEHLAVRAAAAKPGAKEALLIYQQEGGPRLVEPMEKEADGSFALSLGPLMHGGEWLFQARVSEEDGKTAWSETARLQVPMEDADNDNLSAPEERLFATDPANPDTDADGLLDGADPHPLSLDSSPAVYFGPLRAAEDSPFLFANGGSILEKEGRSLSGEAFFVYRLTAEDLPPGAKAVLALRLRGEAKAAFSAEGKSFGQSLSPQNGGEWKTISLPEELLGRKAFFVRVSAAGQSAPETTLQEIAIFSAPEAPSIASPALTPPYPGPGLPVGISVDLWDPQGVTAAWCAYRSGRGFIKLPLEQVGRGPTWEGVLGRFDNARRLDWWVIAEDRAGKTCASRMMHTWVGTFPGEILFLYPGREMKGFWRPAEAGWGAARETSQSGTRDRAELSVAGGAYEVWLLAAGRGREVAVWTDGSFFAKIAPGSPDGWQRLGRIRLAPGNHLIELVSGAGREGAAARYGQIIFTTTSSFRPPPKGRLEIADSISLLTPKWGDKIGARTEVSGTAAGNVARVDFYADEILLRRFTSPPFSFIWDSGRLSEGTHTLRMAGIGRAGQPIAVLEVEVEFAKEKSPK